MSGMQTSFEVSNGVMTIQATQDCTPIMERAQILQREGKHGDSEFKLAAIIPNVIIERYINDSGISYAEWVRNPAHLKRVLNDPALSAFRVWPGAV